MRLFPPHVLLVAMVAAVAVASAQSPRVDSLVASFKSPPADTRPTVWWRFMDDFAAREGIVVELDAMQRLGLCGGVVSYCTSNSKLDNYAELPRPSVDKKWDIKKSQKLLPAGLLGPVKIVSTAESKEQR